MAQMTTHERVSRMLEHREADRVPITDDPWGPTLERWRREGLPAGVDWSEHFGLDHFATIGILGSMNDKFCDEILYLSQTTGAVF